MPELPEVETLVRGLQPAVGTAIAGVEVLDDRLGLDPRPLVGAAITAIERRGKHILIRLDQRGDLVIHLRMSGRLVLESLATEAPYTRLILHLDDGRAIRFVNPRRLGTAAHHPAGFDDRLGIEPLDPAFTADALARLVEGSRAPIKQLLMNQSRIAGVGNIYAAEALWRAGIDPRKPAGTLSSDEVQSLHRSVQAVLRQAIDHLGTTLGSSVSDYRPTVEATGTFQNKLNVYARAGEPCERCGQPIERIVQGGRSTCYCPACQN